MKKIITTIVAVLFVLSSNAMAEGVKFGVDYLKLSTEVGEVDFKTSAVQIRISNEVGPNFDIEGVFAFGVSDDTFKANDPDLLGDISVTTELSNMLGIFAKLHSDSTSGFQAFGRLGLALVKFDMDFDSQNLGPLSKSYDDVGVAFGVGAVFNISETSAIVAEYSIWPEVDFEGIGVDTEVISIGFQVSF